MNQIKGECDEVLLQVSQLYKTTSTYEGLEETHASVELLLEPSQVNSNHDKGIVAVTWKKILRLYSRFGDPMKSIEINTTIRKVGFPVSTKPSLWMFVKLEWIDLKEKEILKSTWRFILT